MFCQKAILVTILNNEKYIKLEHKIKKFKNLANQKRLDFKDEKILLTTITLYICNTINWFIEQKN